MQKIVAHDFRYGPRITLRLWSGGSRPRYSSTIDHVFAVTTVKTELILSVGVLQSCCAVLYYDHDDHRFLQPQQSLLDFFFGHNAKFSLVVLCCITNMMIIGFFSLSSRCSIFSSATTRNSQSGCAVLYYEHDDHRFLHPQQSLLDFFFGHNAKFTVWLFYVVLRTWWSSLSSAWAVAAGFFLRHNAKFTVWLCYVVLRTWSSVSSSSAVVARFFLRPQREIHSLGVLCCITSMMIIGFFILSSRCSIFSSATTRNSVWVCCVVLRAWWSSLSPSSAVVARFSLQPQREIRKDRSSRGLSRLLCIRREYTV